MQLLCLFNDASSAKSAIEQTLARLSSRSTRARVVGLDSNMNECPVNKAKRTCLSRPSTKTKEAKDRVLNPSKKIAATVTLVQNPTTASRR